MSATNRGSTRNERDFYPTPLSAFTPLLPFLNQHKLHWEPACGDGRLIRAMRGAGITADGSDIENHAGETPRDFLSDDTTRETIITNPPFSLAFEFCKHARLHSTETWLLLSLNFLASGRRKLWFQANEPAALFVLSSRPSFCRRTTCLNCRCSITTDPSTRAPKSCIACGSGLLKHSSNDNCEYAWYYWGTRHSGIKHL